MAGDFVTDYFIGEEKAEVKDYLKTEAAAKLQISSLDKARRCSFSACIRSLRIIRTLFLKSISCHLASKILQNDKQLKL